jgi:hypothetical protein
MNELTQKMKKEVAFWGQPDQGTLKQIRELRERHAQELLPLDRHYLTILRTMPPEAIAQGLVSGLKDSLGPKGFKAFQQYLKGRPDDLLAFALKHQKKLMAIIPAIGKQYGREIQDALELPVLALPLILKKGSRMVAEKGQVVLKFLIDVLLRLQLERGIQNAHARIDANPPGFSETQAEHMKVLAKILRATADKLTPIREALVKRLF